MTDKVYSKEADGFRLEIFTDTDIESPRTAYENVGVIWAKDMHRHYDYHEAVADEVLVRIIRSAFLADHTEETWEHLDFVRFLQCHSYLKGFDYVILPLTLHDHGGTSINIGGEGGWDSGLIGYIMVDKERWNVQHGGEWSDENVVSVLTSEVQTWDNWMVYGGYGYTLTQSTSCDCCGHTDYDELSSCWGFLGPQDEAKEAIRGELDTAIQHMIEDWN